MDITGGGAGNNDGGYWQRNLIVITIRMYVAYLGLVLTFFFFHKDDMDICSATLVSLLALPYIGRMRVVDFDLRQYFGRILLVLRIDRDLAVIVAGLGFIHLMLICFEPYGCETWALLAAVIPMVIFDLIKRPIPLPR